MNRHNHRLGDILSQPPWPLWGPWWICGSQWAVDVVELVLFPLLIMLMWLMLLYTQPSFPYFLCCQATYQHQQCLIKDSTQMACSQTSRRCAFIVVFISINYCFCVLVQYNPELTLVIKLAYWRHSNVSLDLQSTFHLSSGNQKE